MIGAFSIGVFAQGQQPAGAPPGGQQPGGAATQATGADQQVMVTGCVQRESDYRRAQDAGRGGVAGTGVGSENEFVLTNAAMASGGRAGADTAPTGTSGSTAAFELSGSGEGQLAQYVGRRVEISGRLKAQELDAAGRPTGGPTAGKPPAGVDVTGKDLKLRELEVVSVKESSGTCPAK